MTRKRLLQAFSGLVLALTLACGWTFQPLQTPTPASPTTALPTMTSPPTDTPTPVVAVPPDAPLVQIGFYSSIYLRYDPEVWEPFLEAPDPILNPQGEAVEALRARSIPGCVLHDNLGHGVPLSWERQDSVQTLGGLEYWVEAWTDTAQQKPVLTVYQYPARQPGTGKRIELVIDLDPQECIRSTEEVLTLSADLIAGQP
jgi:hypothetical protein